MLTDVHFGVLLEVCETCNLCKKIRHLAAKIPEETSTTGTLREGLATLYLLVRQYRYVDRRSKDVGSSEAESEARCEAEG